LPNVGERQRPLRQLDPVQRNEPDHLGKRYRHDDEIAPRTRKERRPTIVPQAPATIIASTKPTRRPWLVQHAQAARQLDVEAERGQALT